MRSSASRWRKMWNKDFADRVRIQYGGSMKPENAKGLLDQADVDGGLIGGAALKAGQLPGHRQRRHRHA